MENRTLKITVILIVLLFAATSCAIVSDYDGHNSSKGGSIRSIVRPFKSHAVVENITVGTSPFGVAFA